MNYAYRKITEEDISFLHQLFSTKEYQEIFFENHTTLSDWKSRFHDIRDFEIVYIKGRKIGVIKVSVDKKIKIILVAIKYDLIGKGIGTKILQDIFEMYGHKEYQITVKASNERAYKFYRKIGFEQYDEENQDLGINGIHKFFHMSYKPS